MSATVLLVDDEPRVTAALRRRLRREGMQVLEAQSGEQALEILDAEAVDVLVSDERMPGMSGSELVRRAAESHPEVIRIILSGQATLDAAVKAINEGQIFRFLLKPCEETELLYCIRQALEHRDLLRENTELRREVDEKMRLLRHLEQDNPGITTIEEDEEGAVVIDVREALDLTPER
ncbi:MAG: response regulator [Acidobacteriota bacterium]|nr:response regulator [Acidobacteriota bacterium]MDQ7087351.1 response regulator [Acidobacteriota bacterium]